MKVGVLGCGVIGLTVAYFLESRGFDVNLVCSDLPGGSSKASGGIITVSFTPTPWPGLVNILKALMGFGGPLAIGPRELLSVSGLRWLLGAYKASGGRVDVVKALASRSLQLYKELLGRLNVRYSQGVIALYSRGENAEAHARLHGGRLAYRDEVEALGFKGFEAGVVAGDEVAVDPVELLEALRSTLTSRVLEDTVVNLKPVGDGVEVALEKGGLLRLDSVIVALGAWSSGILEKLNVRIPLKPARGLALRLKTPEPPVGMPAILEDYGIVVSPAREDLTIVSSFFELKGFTLEWSEGRLKWLKSILSEHVPALRDARLEGYQTGFRPCTPDMLPVVGELPGSKNIYIATGHCRLGVTLAPVTAELILSRIQGAKPELPVDTMEIVSPGRFIR